SKEVSGKNDKETTEEKKTKGDDDEDETTKKKKPDEDETKEDETKNKYPVGHDDWEEYYGVGYSIRLSSDWTETEVAGAELAFAHMSTATDGFAENITTATQDISAYNMDFEEYKDLSLKQLEQLGYDIVEQEAVEVNGVDGYCVVSTVEQQGIKCYIKQWFTVVDDTAIILTIACDEDGYNDLEDEIDEIIETLVID
ncbi:MAG: hypothetical protein K2N34_03380, partial [Lachnospiraceae bacterium]|nr:hypothetical protein [Lachnospiraceae bacterium]